MVLVSNGRFRQRNEGGALTLGTLSDTSNVFTYFASKPKYETCIDELHKGPPFKSGGPLKIVRLELKRGTTETVHLTGNAGRRYDGRFTDSWISASTGINGWDNPSGDTVYSLVKSDSELDALGTTGWNKFKPGKPGVDWGQAVSEIIRDGAPFLPGQSWGLWPRKIKEMHRDVSFGKSLGHEYLNIQWGWLLLLRDLRNLYHTWHNLDRLLAQLKRDNGKRVRRRGKISHGKTVSTYQDVHGFYFMYPTLTSEFYSGFNNRRVIVRTDESSSSFSAGFRYWIPDIGSSYWTIRARAALFGLRPTPSLLWEVIPWSWLYDWFSNVGDVLSNMSTNAAENLVADYAFVMAHRVLTYDVTQDMAIAQPPYNLRVRTQLLREVKQRRHATPYGFGLTFDGFSGRQMLILAALGLARYA